MATTFPSWAGSKSKAGRRANRRRRLAVESLEDRRLLSLWTVTTLSDASSHSGTVSATPSRTPLRAIRSASQAGLSGAIDLSTNEGGQGVLTLSQSVTIDGMGASVTIEGGSTAANTGNARVFVVDAGVTAAPEI